VRRTLRTALGIVTPSGPARSWRRIVKAWLTVVFWLLVLASIVGDSIRGDFWWLVPAGVGVLLGVGITAWARYVERDNQRAQRRYVMLHHHNCSLLPVREGAFVVLHHGSCPCGRKTDLIIGDREVATWLTEEKH